MPYNIKVRPQQFQKWIQTHADRDFLLKYDVDWTTTCPIACFYKELFPDMKNLRVGGNEVHFGQHSEKLEFWLYEIRKEVDGYVRENEKIKGIQVLKIFYNVMYGKAFNL